MEVAGMPTVSIYVKSFGHIPELMGLSRSLITQHPMGRPLGAPGDAARQQAVITAALALLHRDQQAITEFPDPYRNLRQQA